MNWSVIGSISEFVGAIAVVASLVYLAAQIRQNSRAVRATIEQESAKLINQNLIAIASSETLPLLIIKATADFSALNEEERARVLITISGIFRAFEVMYRQYTTRHISEGMWSGYEALLKSLLRAEFFPVFWQIRGATYSPDFQSYIRGVDVSTAPLRAGEAYAQFSDKQGREEPKLGDS